MHADENLKDAALALGTFLLTPDKALFDAIVRVQDAVAALPALRTALTGAEARACELREQLTQAQIERNDANGLLSRAQDYVPKALLAEIAKHFTPAPTKPDCLAPMTPEQRAAFKPLTGAEIDAALSEGKRSADAVRAASGGLPGSFNTPAPTKPDAMPMPRPFHDLWQNGETGRLLELPMHAASPGPHWVKVKPKPEGGEVVDA